MKDMQPSTDRSATVNEKSGDSRTKNEPRCRNAPGS
jgi:hypothetical protein